MNIDKALTLLKSKYLIMDTSSFSAKDAELLSGNISTDDLIEMCHLFEISFYNNNENLIVNFHNTLKDIIYEIACPITRHGKHNDIHIKIPKYLIRKNIYNTFNDKNMHVTASNMKFIEKLEYLYNNKIGIENFELYGYTIEKNHVFIIKQVKNNVNIEYRERYNLYMTTNIISKKDFYLTHSKKNNFSYGIRQELDTELTQNLFGKNFNKLNNKELDVLKAYLY